MLRNLDTIYYKPDLVRIFQPKLISARTFFQSTEVLALSLYYTDGGDDDDDDDGAMDDDVNDDGDGAMTMTKTVRATVGWMAMDAWMIRE